MIICTKSLSARRAWIEIFWAGGITTLLWSLSARRAWIEIANPGSTELTFPGVALRKESVDRNKIPAHCETMPGSRSPQGERG